MTPETFLKQTETYLYTNKYLENKNLTLTPESKFQLENTEVEISQPALQQMLVSCGIPGQFFEKCPPGLKALNFNHFLQCKPNKSHLYRFANWPTAIGKLQGFLGSQYKPMDDTLIMPVIMKALEGQDVDISYNRDGLISYTLIKFNKINITQGDDVFSAGIAITNSETGHSALWIEPVVFNNAHVINNRRALFAEGADIRISHITDFNPERIQKMIKFCTDIAQVGITQYLEYKDDIVTAKEVVNFMKSKDTIPKRFISIMEEQLAHEVEITRQMAWRKILDLAKELPLFQRNQMNQDVGEWTGIFKGYEARMAAIGAAL
jgi:hypothetical protein